MATSKYLTQSFKLDRNTIERIFSKIEIDTEDPLGKCWQWTGARDRLGYGYVRFIGDVALCHRLLYAWLVHPLTDGGRKANDPVLHHLCNNSSCCNPFHLQITSHKEHMLLTKGTIGYLNAAKTSCPNGHQLPQKVDGKPRRCTICYPANKKEYYLAHRDAIIAKVKAWKIAHRT